MILRKIAAKSLDDDERCPRMKLQFFERDQYPGVGIKKSRSGFLTNHFVKRRAPF